MILNVMPKEPLRAVQYTGTNADEVSEFVAERMPAYDIMSVTGKSGAVVWIEPKGKDEQDMWFQELEPGMWIALIDAEGTYLAMTDEYFREHYATLPLVIKDIELTDEQKTALREWNAPIQPMESER